MNIIITGGAGFFASHLIPVLLAQDHHVEALDIVHPSEAWRLDPVKDHPNFYYAWGSSSDIDWEIPGSPIIIHTGAVTDVRFAANNPRYTFQRNTQDCFDLLEKAWFAGGEQIIVFSTHSVYGKQTVIPTPEDVALHPSTIYGAAKAAQEAIALSYYHEKGLPVTIVRPTLMYGERERPGALVSTFLKRAISGQQVTLDGGGRQTRDMNYVGNTVDAIMLLLGQEWAKGEVFNISGNEEISIRDLAFQVSDIAQRPFVDFATEGPARAGEEGRLFLDSSKLAAHGYQPKVKFADGLKRVASWITQDKDGLR